METILEKIDEQHIDQGKIQAAGRIIQEGGLVAFPTETVYGLGADALNPEASRKIYAAKGRPSDNPLIVHIADMEGLSVIAREIPEEALVLAQHFWPGPLTMIFKKQKKVPLTTTGGLDTVAVRMPSHPVALALINASTGYIAAPSANTSGRPSPTEAHHVWEDLRGRIPMILDGGAVGIGIESTIVDFSEGCPTILRPGYITQEMLTQIIGEVCLDPGLDQAHTGERPKAPGMKYRHYAPEAQMILIQGTREAVTAAINIRVHEDLEQGRRPGIIGTDETRKEYREGIVRSIGSRSQPETIAQHMYGILREFDDLKVDVIYSESFPEVGIGQAIMNRMLKAAGHHMIQV